MGIRPVLFEHKKLYGFERPSPGRRVTVPLGQANIVQTGSDLTIVTYGFMVGKCQSVAKRLRTMAWPRV
jgi:pyruvate/2-oxoglutarate/acetoin dehydrogenase E1 component